MTDPTLNPNAPAAERRTPWLVIILVAGAILFFVLPVCGAFVYLFVRGFEKGYTNARARRVAAATVPTGPGAHYSPKNGLITLYYPDDFAAKNLDDSTITINRNLDDGDDEAVLAAALQDPISDDVNEVARILLLGTKKHVESEGGTYREIARTHAPCLPGHPGLKVSSEATLQGGLVLQMSTCFMMHSGHAYELKTIVPSNHAHDELPVLDKIVASTVLAD